MAGARDRIQYKLVEVLLEYYLSDYNVLNMDGSEHIEEVGLENGLVDGVSPVDATTNPLDAEWVDRQDWNMLVAEYQGMLLGTSRRTGLIEADVEDSVQTTFLRLLERHDQIRDPSRLGGWLRVTVHYDSVHRSQRRKRESPSLTEGANNIPDNADVEDEVINHFEERRNSEALQVAISRLSDSDQRLTSLLFGLDREPASYKEICSLTGISIGSIGPTRLRILKKLRGYMTEVGLGSSEI